MRRGRATVSLHRLPHWAAGNSITFFLTSRLPLHPLRASLSSPHPEFTQQLQMAFVMTNFKLLQMKEDHGLVHVAICKRERKDEATTLLHGTHFSSWLSAIKCQEEAKLSCQAVSEKGFASWGSGFAGRKEPSPEQWLLE